MKPKHMLIYLWNIICQASAYVFSYYFEQPTITESPMAQVTPIVEVAEEEEKSLQNGLSDEEKTSTRVAIPSSHFWHAVNPVADQIFITDVTVNLKTVTIRECKTEKGFFRDRDESKHSDIKWAW